MATTTLNPLDKTSSGNLTNGNLRLTYGLNLQTAVRGIDPKYTGQMYVEYTFAGSNTAGSCAGFSSPGASLADNTNFTGLAVVTTNGNIVVDGITEAGNLGVFNAGTQVVSVAIDLVNDLIWFRLNGGSWNADAGADPATATGGYDISGITATGIWPYVDCNGNALNPSVTANFGASAFSFAVPSGFSSGWTSGDTTFFIDPPSVAVAITSSSNFPPVTLSTQGLPNTALMIAVHTEKNGTTPVVSTITSTNTNGLWRQRSQLHVLLGAVDNDLEIWYCIPTGALTSESITVALNGTPDRASLISFAHVGVYTLLPFDNNISLPAKNQSVSSTQATVSGIGTTSPESTIVGFTATSSGQQPDNGTGQTFIKNVRATGGVAISYLMGQGVHETVVQSGLTMNTSAFTAAPWVMMVEALVPINTGPSAPDVIGIAEAEW